MNVRLRSCLGRAVLARWFIVAALVVLPTAACWWLLAGPSEAAPGPAATVTVTLSANPIKADGTSTTKATATLRDSNGNLVPTDTIVFSANQGDTAGATTNNGDGTYTAIITSSTTPGQVTITATDKTANISGAATLTQTAGASTLVTVELSPNSIVANGIATTTATASVTDVNGNPVPSDSVVFSSSDANEKASATTNSGNGTYTATITSSTTPGTVTITAADESTHISGQATLTQTATGSGTMLVASPSAPVTNQGVTLFAAVTSSPGPPSGTITFEDRDTPISGCLGKPISSSNPTATCQTSFAASTSPEELTAVFTPSSHSNVGASTGVDIVTVGKDSTSPSLAVSRPSANVGARVTYTATVTPGHAGPTEPTGTVEFLDGRTPISSCTNQPLTQQNGSFSAACTVSYARTGTHGITAMYRGDANFLASTSQAQSVSVPPGPVLGTIRSTMHWSFYFTPDYTTVLALRIQGAPIGATVVVSCTGKGCPFRKSTTAVSKPKPCTPKRKHKCPAQDPGTVRLQPRFGNHHLHVGARIKVELVRPDWIGKYYAFTVRSQRGPSINIHCLAPGGTRPGIGC